MVTATWWGDGSLAMHATESATCSTDSPVLSSPAVIDGAVEMLVPTGMGLSDRQMSPVRGGARG
jgi:hypothetical protein